MVHCKSPFLELRRVIFAILVSLDYICSKFLKYTLLTVGGRFCKVGGGISERANRSKTQQNGSVRRRKLTDHKTFRRSKKSFWWKLTTILRSMSPTMPDFLAGAMRYSDFRTRYVWGGFSPSEKRVKNHHQIWEALSRSSGEIFHWFWWHWTHSRLCDASALISAVGGRFSNS